MQAVFKTIGLDIAKSVFQVHGVDADGQVVIRRKLKRRYVLAFFEKVPPCLVGMEACATSHHWSRDVSRRHHAYPMLAVSVDARCAPKRIGEAHLPNELANLCGYLWPTTERIRFVAPISSKTSAMPADHRFRSNDFTCLKHLGCQAIEAD